MEVMFHLDLAQEVRNLSDDEQVLYDDLISLLPSFEVATEAPLVVAPCLASKGTSDCQLRAPPSIVVRGVVDEMLSALLMLSIFPPLPAAMDRASLVVDGSTSVDKKMPPGFLVVDGSAAALFPSTSTAATTSWSWTSNGKEGDVFSSNGRIAT